MKIIFFGNTSFGVPTLEKLNESKIEIAAVVTNSDLSKKRKKKSKTSIKSWAEQNSINLIQQDNLNDIDFIENLKSFNADFFIVIAYKILPKKIFSIPKLGTMNLHGSLLPKYRGAAPIQRSILNGDKVTGVSTFIIDKNIDTGNIILQSELLMKEKGFKGLKAICLSPFEEWKIAEEDTREKAPYFLINIGSDTQFDETHRTLWKTDYFMNFSEEELDKMKVYPKNKKLDLNEEK